MRLLYLVSHPIQYQAPLLRRIAAEPGIDLRVVFGSLASAQVHREPEFGVDVAWDVPLLEGYAFTSLGSTDLGQEIAAADAVWIHGWQYSWQRRAVVAAARRGVPVLIRGENWSAAMPDPAGLLGWTKRAWRRRLFRRVQGFLAIGRCNHDYYAAHGVPEGRLFSMPYAVDNDFFAARATAAAGERDELRRQLGVLQEQPVLLFVGKLTARKCPDLLAAAWTRAGWPGNRPALLFVGDGAMRDAVGRIAPEAIFTGFRNQSELPGLYDLADLLVVPSRREPWGLVVNEAMACGTAVVASNEVGAAYDLVGPETGGVFRSGDVEALAATLSSCLTRSGALGRAARQRIAGWDFEAGVRGLKAALDAVVQ